VIDGKFSSILRITQRWPRLSKSSLPRKSPTARTFSTKSPVLFEAEPPSRRSHVRSRAHATAQLPWGQTEGAHVAHEGNVQSLATPRLRRLMHNCLECGRNRGRMLQPNLSLKAVADGPRFLPGGSRHP